MTDLTLPVNTLLHGGTYRIVRFISSGGFGNTYQAEHVMLGKQLAIKEFFIRDFCNRDEQTNEVSVGAVSKKAFVDRLRNKFIDEARALSALKHPGIVNVSDVFEENGTAYYVMDYIDGPSLNDIVKTYGPLSEADAVAYIRQVCDALAYVHENHRLHLDIKPGNIMVTGKGRAVLIDFGASKQYDEYQGQNTSTLLGMTPGYAPVEQMCNDISDFLPATDIYAVGATLYKLLTGETPPNASKRAGGADMPALPYGISSATINAVYSAMNLRKADRPQSIAEFVNILNGGPVPVPGGGGGNNEGTIPHIPQYPAGGNSYPPQFDNSQPSYPPMYPPSAPQKPKKNSFWKVLFIILGVIAGLFVALVVAAVLKPEWFENRVENYEIVAADNVKYKYTGLLEDDKPTGIGKGVYPSGVYEGNYTNGKREGEGTYKTSDKKNTFVGTWHNDKYKQGKLTFDDGSVFEGHFVDNLPNDGKLTYADKSYFEGTFKNNAPYNGKLYNADGKLELEVKEGKVQ